jgi:hypothetical protein
MENYNQWCWKLYRWIKWELPNQHRYIQYGVRNLYRWFWTIWKDRDWDHTYIFKVLKFKLEAQAKHLSKFGFHESTDRDVELMMTCVRLIDKIQNESYYDELYDAEEKTPEEIKKLTAKHDRAKRLLFNILDNRIERWWN